MPSETHKTGTTQSAIRLSLWITLVIVVSSLAVLTLQLSNLDALSKVAQYISGIFSSLALLWVVVNAVLLRDQIALQQDELAMTRDTLNRTASAMFSQFYIAYHSQLELTINNICARIVVILGLRPADLSTPTSNIMALTSHPRLTAQLRDVLRSDKGTILRLELEQYLSALNPLTNLALDASADTSTKELLSLFTTANPMYQLGENIRAVLESTLTPSAPAHDDD